MATMRSTAKHGESHRGDRIAWLRAAVLGANDGLISTSSLIVGVASADPGRNSVMLAAVAGIVGGALSMAAGEYVSVSTQSDTERADLDRESRELAESPESEQLELVNIYVKRGLHHDLAVQVATQLTAKDALETHARDELGITTSTTARPVLAAVASAASFAVGAAPPAVLALLLSDRYLTLGVVGSTIILLLSLGGTAARLGGASVLRGAIRVALWGAAAMGVSNAAGSLFGAA